VTEAPEIAPLAPIVPDALETLEAVPDSARVATIVPFAADTVAEMPEMTRGAGPAIDRAPEPWLGVALVPDRAIL